MELTDDDVLARVEQINVWRRGDERAPHKPLLLLLALARLQRGEPRLVAFEEVEPVLRRLLIDFGPPRRSVHPEFPFWYLQNDEGLWEVSQREQLQRVASIRKRKGSLSSRVLKDQQTTGGFPPELHDYLQKREDLVNRLAATVLERHFPATMHEDVLDAVGLPWVVVTRAPRDPDFRDVILRSYEHRCAICGYDGRLGRSGLGLEAAHIKWHAAGGPDIVQNGLALCCFHHKVFDLGAIGFDDEGRVMVSQDVHGQTEVDNWLLRFTGRQMRAPQFATMAPSPEFVRWHQREVFRKPARIA